MILTTLRLPAEAHQILDDVAEVVGPDGWQRHLGAATALIPLLTVRVDEALLDRAPRLRVVACATAGYEHVDVTACRKRGIVVTHTPDVLTDATADLTWALILATVRRLPQAERSLRAGEFRGWGFWDYLGGDLRGRVLGVLGMGRIGQAVARRAAAFGMAVCYTGRRRLPDARGRELNAEPVAFEELLATSDVLSLHLPLTSETRHLLDAAALRRMKPGAYLINTARGPLIDEAALVEALRSGRLAGAGLDVYEREPEVHAGLLELPNVVLLPHIGSATHDTRTAMATLAARNVRAALTGAEPPTPVGWGSPAP